MDVIFDATVPLFLSVKLKTCYRVVQRNEEDAPGPGLSMNFEIIVVVR